MPSAMTGEIRPGISRPDWSVVTKPAAHKALMGRDRARSGFWKKWSQWLSPTEDLVWRTVLELFASDGRPPSALEIAGTVGVSGEQARKILAHLQLQDLLAMDEAATTIVYA